MMTEVLSRASGEHGPACQASRDDRIVCVVVTTLLWELCKAAQGTNMTAIWFCSFWLDLCPHPTPGRSSEHTLCLLCPRRSKEQHGIWKTQSLLSSTQTAFPTAALSSAHKAQLKAGRT